MTKRILLSIFAMIALTTAAAQDTVSGFRFGYLSYEAALQSMADYQQVQQKMDQMRQQFQAETLRVEDEFNLKYEEFLDGQRDFPKTILQKRQSELQELMERNIRFKEESKQELEQTEKLLMAPLKIRLIEQLGTIARERGYAFIVDTDQKAMPYINPSMGEDINQVFKTILVHGDKIGYLICVVPGNLEVDLKGAAKVSGNKKIDTVPLKDLTPLTGYIRGGCSPLGLKKNFPIFI